MVATQGSAQANRGLCACGCGSAIPAVDAKGRPRRYRVGHQGSHRWTVEIDDRLLTLYERGVPDTEIARKIKRTQAAVVARRSKILARLGRGDLLLTGEVARLFGVTGTCVRNWIKRGWLKAEPSGWLRACKGTQYRAWWSREADVMALMRDEALWARWWPEDMPAGHWRDVALELRGGVRFLTSDEVGRHLGFCPSHVLHLIREGRLRGVKGCTRFPSGRKGSRAWYVRSDHLPASAAEIGPVTDEEIARRRHRALDEATVQALRASTERRVLLVNDAEEAAGVDVYDEARGVALCAAADCTRTFTVDGKRRYCSETCRDRAEYLRRKVAA